MKLLVLVLSLAVGALGYIINVPVAPSSPGIAHLDWVRRQKLILPLFENVCDESNDSMVVRMATEFLSDSCLGTYEDTDVIVRFKELLGKGLLPKGEIFSEYNKEHFSAFEIIRDVLYSARDFDIFFKAASWARQNVNCGLYIDAIYSAIIYRQDTSKLTVPAPYEILPNYFFKRDVVIAGSFLLAGLTAVPTVDIRDDGNSYIIDTNYTSDFAEDEGNIMAYFHEDIGLNSYIFLRKLMNKSLWTNGDESRFGEYMYHFMKQLMTRYNLERISNGLMDLEDINWNAPVMETYNPMLLYSNGKDFGFRGQSVETANSVHYEFLKNIENNIASVVSRMIEGGYSKTEILNTLMEVMVTGDNSYETVAFMTLGRDQTVNRGPSVLEHYMTLVRDPMFWKINRMIVKIIDKALSILPTYTRNELYFAGVEVMNVEMKKPMTTCEKFEIDVTEALKPSTSENSFLIKISQPRLNHKPISLKISINSFAAQRGLVKIYLGPKMLPGEQVTRKNQFMLLDSFEVNLKKGSNVLTRSSTDLKSLSEDFFSLKTLRKKIEDAEFGLNALSFEDIMKMTGFPSRLVIPKGSEEGMPFQIFVFVAPLTKISVTDQSTTSIEFNTAALSPGYPLDLSIDDWQLFDLPNALVKDIIISHKGMSSSNGEGGAYKNQYNENSYDYSGNFQQLVGKQTLRPGFSKPNASYRKGYKPERPTFDHKIKWQDRVKKTEENIKPILNENKLDFNMDETTDFTIFPIDKSVFAFDDTSIKVDKMADDRTSSIDADKKIQSLVLDPIDYEENVVKNFVLQKTKNKMEDNVKIQDNMIKNIDKTIKNSESVVKTIDKSINSSNNIVKTIDKNAKLQDKFTMTKDKDIEIDFDGGEVKIEPVMKTDMDTKEDDVVHRTIVIDKFKHVDKNTNEMTTENSEMRNTILKAKMPKRKPTVYDYLMKEDEDDNRTDEKVFE